MAGTTPSELDANAREVRAFTQRALYFFLADFLDLVKLRTPVITGKLRDGWYGMVQDREVVVANDVDYASYVEYGTHKMAPRGMLRATANESEQIMTRAVARAKLKD